MAKIICEAEAHDYESHPGGTESAAYTVAERAAHGSRPVDAGRPFAGDEIADAIARAAVFTAAHLGIRQIVAYSQSGFTARLLSRYRPRAPILAFTTSHEVARRVQILWGTRPFVINDPATSHEEVIAFVEERLLASGMIGPGERLILLMGDPRRDKPGTSLMRLHEVDAS